MFNETFLKLELLEFHINGLKTVRFDRLYSNEGGNAFLIKKYMIFETVELCFTPSALETECVSVTTSVGNNNLTPFEWQKFLDTIKKLGDKFCVGGDLNAHHPSWGSDHCCHNMAILFIISQIQKIS